MCPRTNANSALNWIARKMPAGHIDVSKYEFNKDEYNDHVHFTYTRKQELKHTYREIYKDRCLIILPLNSKIIQAGKYFFRKQSKAKLLNGYFFICNVKKWSISSKIINIL